MAFSLSQLHFSQCCFSASSLQSSRGKISPPSASVHEFPGRFHRPRDDPHQLLHELRRERSGSPGAQLCSRPSLALSSTSRVPATSLRSPSRSCAGHSGSGSHQTTGCGSQRGDYRSFTLNDPDMKEFNPVFEIKSVYLPSSSESLLKHLILSCCVGSTIAHRKCPKVYF